MKLSNLTLFFLVIPLVLSGCSEKDEGRKENKILENTKTLDTGSEEWTYISLETGQIVGTSKVGDEEEDRRWSGRTDWDIALYDKYIRTNSGTSGNGYGGMTETDIPYEQLTKAPENGYAVDSKSTEIW